MLGNNRITTIREQATPTKCKLISKRYESRKFKKSRIIKRKIKSC